jgi:tripartite-type tricarboxylate transporter receptor subunit TctC
MRLPRRRFLQFASGLLVSPALARSAKAQGYPNRPITLVVPYPAGGPTDIVARLIAERMRVSLGQPIVIENVSGGGGTIAVTRVARAAGDGYTLSIGHWGSHVINGAVYSLPFDLLTDLEPIALIADGPQLAVASKAVPARDIKELVAWLNANPGKAMVGTTGVGGASHLAAILFAKTTGTNIQIVPSRLRTAHAGPAVRPNSSGVRPGLERAAAGQERQSHRLCGDVAAAARRRAGDSDR